MVKILQQLVQLVRQYRRIDCAVYYRWDEDRKELVPLK